MISRWSQSDRVALLVGESIGTPAEFLVPLEFLRRRSREFRTQLQLHREYSEHIKLPETRVSTFEDFLIWTFRPHPKIDAGATFEEVVQLGIFAWKYQIPSLSNQVTDVIRTNVASCEWPLQASIVDKIYEAVPSKCPLREVVRAALGQLPRPNAEGEVLKDDWKATFLKHAELGWDYIQAGATEWARREYLTDFCRFHDHQGVSHRGPFAYCDGCPFAREDCYPDEPEEEVIVVNGHSNVEPKSEPAITKDIPTDVVSSEETGVHKLEEHVGSDSPDTEANSLQRPRMNHAELNDKASKEPAPEYAHKATETPEEVSVNGTEHLPEVTEDDVNGVKESESVADVEGTTVTSEGPGDELNSLKENESVIEEVDEKLEEKLDGLKIEDTKGGDAAAEKTASEPKPKKKNKPKRRNTNKA